MNDPIRLKQLAADAQAISAALKDLRDRYEAAIAERDALRAEVASLREEAAYWQSKATGRLGDGGWDL